MQTDPKQQKADRWGFYRMAPIIPEGGSGSVKVVHVTISEQDAKFSRLREAMTGGREQAVVPGTIAQLLVNGGLVMSDTPMERNTNRGLLRSATGDVLIAGLGLGLVLPPVLAKEGVKSVTVIEKSLGVIQLIEPRIRAFLGDVANKLTVVEGDIFTWRAPRGARYDTVYFDIWPDIHRDNLIEMRKLHARYRRRKATPYSWVSSWLFDDLKNNQY